MSDRSGSAARDRQVAEVVMGWPRTLRQVWSDSPPIEVWRAEMPYGPSWISEEAIPQFSTDIRAAWMVVDHMHQLGWNIDISTEEDGWSCAMWNTTTEVAAVGETAAEAVCACALRAVQP